MASQEIKIISISNGSSMSANKTVPSSSENDCTKFNSSSFLIRNSLRPLSLCLSTFGLNFGAHFFKGGKKDKGKQVSKVYSICVLLLLLLNIIRYVFSTALDREVSIVVNFEILLWYARCFVQAAYCLILCRRSPESRFSKIQQLISEYDDVLKQFSVPDRSSQRSFLRISKAVFSVLLVIVMVNVISFYAVLFVPYSDFIRLIKPLVHPLPVNMASKLSSAIIHTYNSVAWVVPIVLYCLLCNCLNLIFNQFYVGIKATDGKKTMKRNIKKIRRQYVLINKLCGKTDDVLGFFAICVYLFDIILCCSNLYHLIYIAQGFQEKALDGFWAVIAVGNLFAISFIASRLVDKVRSTRFFQQLCLAFISIMPRHFKTFWFNFQ